jgi:hypothetical protein
LAYPNTLGLAWFAKPNTLGLAWFVKLKALRFRPKRFARQPWQTQVLESKNLFKSMIGLQKQIVPHSSRIFHSYAVELNCKLFFVCATYFINLLYSKRKEWEKTMLSFN